MSFADHYPHNTFAPVVTHAEPTPYQEAYLLDDRGIFLGIVDGCGTCSSAGGFLEREMQGDPPMTGMVSYVIPCPDCIGSALCPGCMQSLSLSFDLSAFGTDTKPRYEVTKDAIWGMPLYLNTFSYEDAISQLPTDPESFTCLICGWTYDPDRHADQHEDDYDDGDYDYPALDASGYFGGI